MANPMRSLCHRTPAILAVVLAIGVSTPRAGRATAIDMRPLSDFLSVQGTTSVFIPPFPDFIAWFNNDPITHLAFVDYAGLASAYLASNGGPSVGTQTRGTVVERPLPDGRAQVTVNIRTTNALSWAIAYPASDVATDPVHFGYRSTELLADPSLTPALSSSEFKVVFKNTAMGDPLPDLVNAFILGEAAPGQELVSLQFGSGGTGPFRSPSGLPEGTPGRMNVVQTGLFMTQFKGATADGFPAERVEFHTVGSTILAHPSRTQMSSAGSGSSAGKIEQNMASRNMTWGRIKALYRYR